MTVIIDGTNGLTFPDSSQQYNSYYGFKNRLINGGMAIDQRNSGASQTFTAAAALAYSVDRWYGYCTGANVTGQRIATNNLYTYQFTGAASVTGIGFGQRIEAQNIADLAGSTVALSVNLANSLLTSVTWTAYYANTTDTFGTLASPTRTQIATGTFTVTSTLTNYSTQISLPSAANTGVEIVFTVGAQTSGTWTIDNVQLEKGSVATAFDVRSVGTELALCQRYYETGYYTAGYYWATSWGAVRYDAFSWIVPKRTTPIVTASMSGAGWTGTWSLGTPNGTTCTFSNSATINTGTFTSNASWVASAEL
jgi:hypothetical protein